MLARHAIAYLLLRLSIGVVLFFFGVGKFLRGYGSFVAGMEKRFSGSVLPVELVTPFARVRPFAEVGLGLLLLVGLFSGAALVLTGLLFLALIFGTVLEPSPPTVANNVVYTALTALLLWALEHNRYSADHLLGRGPSTRS
jgi:thiosulfate dehydrogenase [quinone] large subunit